MNKEKEFAKKEILEKAKDIEKLKKVCSNCLGRQFAQVSHGFTNKQRGDIIRKLLKTKEPKECEICDALFKNLEKYGKEAIGDLKKYNFKTFLVGTQLSYLLAKKEEYLWEEIGAETCESIKSEINREVGKLISKQTGKEMEREIPEINVIVDLEKNRIRIKSNPLFVYGGYKKLVRGIPQTKWETYPETVEDIIAKPFMKATKGEEHALHGMGREDIDARCLDFRPFVFEVVNPQIRSIDLEKMKKEINKSKKVEVSDLKFSNKKEVRELKAAKPAKSYRVLVEFEKQVTEKDLAKLKKLKGLTIKQETPTRVLHRRADKLRDRKVRQIKWKILGKKNVEFEVKGDAGLYVKELVHGDDGRTKPSISEILGNKGQVKELDVIKIWTKLDL